MKLLLFFVIITSVVCCKQNGNKMVIKYFEAGNEKKIKLVKSLEEDVLNALKKIIEMIDDEARLVVDDERLDDIKKNDEVLEVILNRPISISSKRFRNYKVKKILIPVSGDLASAETKTSVIIFLGDSRYDSSPFISSTGKNILDQILTSIKLKKP